jgi:hypothetical protein
MDMTKAKEVSSSVTQQLLLSSGQTRLKDQANKELMKKFVQMYMSTNAPISDAKYREGSIIQSIETDEDVYARDYPPFDRDVEQGERTVRIGGFKDINNLITKIQTSLRYVTGEIRTKITEWDLSLYLQEGLFDKDNILSYSLLYRIYNDNPAHVTNDDALSFGVLNSAVSNSRDKRYRPYKDPDLKYWIAPSSSPTPPAASNKKAKVSALSRSWWNFFSTYFKVALRSNTAHRKKLAGINKDIKQARLAGWTSWYPPFWQLFFFNRSYTTVMDDEEVKFREKYEKKQRSYWKNKAIPAATKSVNSLGFNSESPILYGMPRGKYLDPRSIEGFLNNDWNRHSPKMTYSASSNNPINREYRGFNPTQAYNMLIDGWGNGYWQTYRATIKRRKGHRRRVTWKDRRGHRHHRWVTNYHWVTRHVMRRRWVAVNHPYPTAYGRIIKEVITKQVPVTARPQRSPTRSSGWLVFRNNSSYNNAYRQNYYNGSQPQYRTIKSTRYIIPYIRNAAGFDTILNNAGGKLKPLFIGADGNSLFQGIVTKGTRRVSYRKRHKFFRWVWYTTRHKMVPCYIVEFDDTHGVFVPNIRGENVPVWKWWHKYSHISAAWNNTYNVSHTSISQWVGNGKTFYGMYLGIPKRTLGPNDSIIYDNWSSVGIPDYLGARLAKGLITNYWKYGHKLVQLNANMIYTSQMFSQMRPYLNDLYELFHNTSASALRNLITNLEPETTKKPEVRKAYYYFTDKNFNYAKDYLHRTLNKMDSLLTIVESVKQNGQTALTYKNTSSYFRYYRELVNELRSHVIVNLINNYLILLYEWRAVLLKQRLNKIDGTLLQIAKLEMAIALSDQTFSNSPDIMDTVFKEDLPVVFKNTNLTLQMRANARLNNAVLPKEHITYVYVKVQYDKDHKPIRPHAGTYRLLSFESVQHEDVWEPVDFYITFEEGKAPPIVHDVLATIDGEKLVDVVKDPDLNMREKICKSKVLEDWWKIQVPESLKDISLPSRFLSKLHLLLLPTGDEIKEMITAIAGTYSPHAIDNMSDGDIANLLKPIESYIK